MPSVIRWRLCADSAGMAVPAAARQEPTTVDARRATNVELRVERTVRGSAIGLLGAPSATADASCHPTGRQHAIHLTHAEARRRSVWSVKLVPTSITRRTNSRRQHGRQNLGRPEDGLRIEGLAGVSCEKKAPIALGIFLAQRSRRPATLQRSMIFTIVEIATKTLPGEVSCFALCRLARPPAISNRIPTSCTFPMLLRTGNCSTKIGTLYGCTIRCRYCVIQLCNQADKQEVIFLSNGIHFPSSRRPPCSR